MVNQVEARIAFAFAVSRAAFSASAIRDGCGKREELSGHDGEGSGKERLLNQSIGSGD